jgi:hypothetical protein
MEHLLYHFILLLGKLDECWLRPLRYWIPDYQHVLRSPATVFQNGPIEIGPWNRYDTICGWSVLLAVPVVLPLVLADAIAVSICLFLPWLVITGLLTRSCRGGTCHLKADGVEFQYRGVTVFCPWNLFQVTGQPIYYPDKRRLDLPIAPAAMDGIEVRNHDGLVCQGPEVRSKHFRMRLTGEICLKFVYGVKPADLGGFLLQLGRVLGTLRDQDGPAFALMDPLPVACKGDWIEVSLTRLEFPRCCCGCGAASSRWEVLKCQGFLERDCRPVSVPVCNACRQARDGLYRRALIKNALVILLVSVVLGALLGVFLFQGIPGGVWMGPPFTGVLTFFFVGIPLACFLAPPRARAASAPVHLSKYQSEKGTIQIRFRNTQYAKLFVARMAGEVIY